jgi:hypothetical protein
MTNATHKFLSIYLFLFLTLLVSSTSCSSSGETYCINTASGNSHSMLEAEMCAGWNQVPTCTHLGHQHRRAVTRGCTDTISLSWWWPRCARNMWRVINRNKYIENNLCITLVIYQELYNVRGWGSTPTTPAVDSRKAWQYPRLHIQFYKLLMMGAKTARNM